MPRWKWDDAFRIGEPRPEATRRSTREVKRSKIGEEADRYMAREKQDQAEAAERGRAGLGRPVHDSEPQAEHAAIPNPEPELAHADSPDLDLDLDLELPDRDLDSTPDLDIDNGNEEREVVDLTASSPVRVFDADENGDIIMSDENENETIVDADENSDKMEVPAKSKAMEIPAKEKQVEVEQENADLPASPSTLANRRIAKPRIALAARESTPADNEAVVDADENIVDADKNDKMEAPAKEKGKEKEGEVDQENQNVPASPSTLANRRIAKPRAVLGTRENTPAPIEAPAFVFGSGSAPPITTVFALGQHFERVTAEQARKGVPHGLSVREVLYIRKWCKEGGVIDQAFVDYFKVRFKEEDAPKLGYLCLPRAGIKITLGLLEEGKKWGEKEHFDIEHTWTDEPGKIGWVVGQWTRRLTDRRLVDADAEIPLAIAQLAQRTWPNHEWDTRTDMAFQVTFCYWNYGGEEGTRYQLPPFVDMFRSSPIARNVIGRWNFYEDRVIDRIMELEAVKEAGWDMSDICYVLCRFEEDFFRSFNYDHKPVHPNRARAVKEWDEWVADGGLEREQAELAAARLAAENGEVIEDLEDDAEAAESDNLDDAAEHVEQGAATPMHITDDDEQVEHINEHASDHLEDASTIADAIAKQAAQPGPSTSRAALKLHNRTKHARIPSWDFEKKFADPDFDGHIPRAPTPTYDGWSDDEFDEVQAKMAQLSFERGIAAASASAKRVAEGIASALASGSPGDVLSTVSSTLSELLAVPTPSPDDKKVGTKAWYDYHIKASRAFLAKCLCDVYKPESEMTFELLREMVRAVDIDQEAKKRVFEEAEMARQAEMATVEETAQSTSQEAAQNTAQSSTAPDADMGENAKIDKGKGKGKAVEVEVEVREEAAQNSSEILAPSTSTSTSTSI